MTGSFTTRFGSAPEESAKAPCVASTTANIVLSGEQTIDTVSVLSGNRVLVRNQTNATENGIYDVFVGPWIRSTDFNNHNDVINGILVIDANQSNNGIYQLLFTGDYSPGITPVSFNEILFNTLTSKIGSTGIQGEYNEKGQYHIRYMDDLIGIDLTGFVVGETILCNALNLGALGTYSVWEKVADSTTPPDPLTGLNATDNMWYSSLTNATQFKQVRQLSCLTIADLKLIAGLPNQIIEVISYDAPDFGLANPYKGNGKFVWDSTSTETDDSGTTRTVIQATGVTTGRWIRVYDALVDAAGNFTGTDVETALSECATKTTTQTLDNKTLTDPVLDSPVLDGILTGTAFKDEDDMVSDSPLAVASQQSIKAYIDSSLLGALVNFNSNSTTVSVTTTTSGVNENPNFTFLYTPLFITSTIVFTLSIDYHVSTTTGDDLNDISVTFAIYDALSAIAIIRGPVTHLNVNDSILDPVPIKRDNSGGGQGIYLNTTGDPLDIRLVISVADTAIGDQFSVIWPSHRGLITVHEVKG